MKKRQKKNDYNLPEIRVKPYLEPFLKQPNKSALAVAINTNLLYNNGRKSALSKLFETCIKE